jgi:hypothetical protein
MKTGWTVLLATFMDFSIAGSVRCETVALWLVLRDHLTLHCSYCQATNRDRGQCNHNHGQSTQKLPALGNF